MMKSQRFYITLNSSKPKDMAILELLNSTYSETETIKSILYQFATNGCKKVIIGEEIICDEDDEEVVKADDSIGKVRKGADSISGTNKEITIDDDIRNMFA